LVNDPMHLDLPHLTYSGPPPDDPAILDRLPQPLAEALRQRNGCVAYEGGLHVRGACTSPGWHSLRNAWEGPLALHQLYDEVEEADIPFAEDALGDQFLIRDGAVLHLWAETGEIETAAASLDEFFGSVLADPQGTLALEPLLAYRAEDQQLAPGQLLMAYPPFCVTAAEKGVKLSAMDALERRLFLGAVASQIRGLPEGAEVQLKLSD
jgi:hypothetical protein